MHSAVPLGRLLVASGLLTQQALDEVLQFQRTDGQGRRLGELLEVRGLVRPHQLAQFLSHQLACPWVSLQRVEVTREAVEVLPREIALKHHMVPVHLRSTPKGGASLYVAMDDPTDDVALAEAAAAATMTVKPMVALTSEIRTLLDRLYGGARAGAPNGRTSSPPPPPRSSAPSPPVVQTPSPAPVAVAPSGRPPKPPPPAKTTGSHPPVDGAAVSPPPPVVISAKVPPPAPTTERDLDASVLDEADVIDDGSSPGSIPTPLAKIVVIDAPESFLVTVRSAAAMLGADAIAATMSDAAKMAATAAEHAPPCAFVVTEAVYANERSGLSQLALDAGAQLVVSSDDFQKGHFENLLEGAIRRWRRSSYDKGTILEGRYELLRDLGGRLVGSRWEVRHLRTARRSILKIGVRSAHDETDAEAVRREQMALARVHHPGAVDLRDAGNTELGDPYIIVEMLEGRTLEGLVAARGALSVETACALIHQIALVLSAAHDAGVRHGAVRPDNVLIVRDVWGVERAKLIQWEAATVMDGPPNTNTAHDIAGLGACAFLALVGRARNEGEDVATVGLDPKLMAVVARSITGRQRFTTIKELIDALLVALPGRQPSERPTRLLHANPGKRGASIQPAKAPDKTPLPSELRRFPRAAYRTPVRVEVPSVGAVDGRTEDISEGGLFVVSRGKIADGSEVTVRFALPIDGKVVSEAGVVRWSRSPKSGDTGEPRAIGIELVAPGVETVKQIARYVQFMSSEST